MHYLYRPVISVLGLTETTGTTETSNEPTSSAETPLSFWPADVLIVLESCFSHRSDRGSIDLDRENRSTVKDGRSCPLLLLSFDFSRLRLSWHEVCPVLVAHHSVSYRATHERCSQVFVWKKGKPRLFPRFYRWRRRAMGHSLLRHCFIISQCFFFDEATSGDGKMAMRNKSFRSSGELSDEQIF